MSIATNDWVRVFRTIKRNFKKSSFLLPWVVGGVTLGFTLWSFIEAKIVLKEKMQTLFQDQITQIKEKISNRIQSYENVLIGTKVFFTQGYTVDRSGWHRYIQQLALEKNYPGFKTIEYIEKGRAPFLDEPMRSAAEVSRDTGLHTISSKVFVNHASGQKTGFYQFIPIYKEGQGLQATAVSEKRNQLQGWVYGVFVTENLLKDIVDPAKSKIAFGVYDGLELDAEKILYSNFPEQGDSFLSDMSAVKVGGHFWSLLFKTEPSFAAMVDYSRPYSILGVGLLLSGLLFFVTRAQIEKGEAAVKHLHSVLKVSDDAIIGEKLDGTIVSWNSGAEKLYGYTAYETVGRNISMLNSENRPNEMRHILSKMNHGMMVDHHETRHLRKDGRVIDVVLTLSPIKNASGQTVGALTMGKDITQTKEARELIERQLETLSETREELQHSAPHYFYGSVAKIFSFANYLKKHSNNLDETSHNYLYRLHSSALHLKKMLEKVMAFSKITTGPGVSAVEVVDLKQIVNETISDLEIPLNRNKSCVTVGSLPTLKANSLRMRQLFQTILLNTLCFAKKGQNLNISIQSVMLRDGSVQIRIDDDGAGVDEKYIEKLFHPFEPNHHKDGYEEIAFGFAMCRKIVMYHGGKIALKSVPNRGSSVIITLPMG